ncbi:unnamed protein product [Adineta steineri]|uniref:Heme haloperoxidase family profile domain-containing protein n=1 Tax=Adineta steineri TaxID=433720 RepID=A0A814RHY5_9BILA|nr:unnamed protein product [Adineta steineri]CAF4069364.1 unnamed protein product [Adineta steineri]
MNHIHLRCAVGCPFIVEFELRSSSKYMTKSKSATCCPFAKLGNQANSGIDTASDILNSVFSNVEEPLLRHGEQIRPESGFYYQEPNITANPPDQRGVCPGLNLLANYGYLPRNGIVTLTQVLEATSRGFNMGTDLALVLAATTIFTSGNILTETFSLGGPDPRVGIGNVGGLDRHNNVECDISPNREDYYTGKCDNHHLSSRRFKQNVKCAEQQCGLFNLDAMTQQYSQNADYSKTNNPYLFYSIPSLLVSVGAHIFYSYLFSNGTYEFGGTPDYTSISNIVGAKLVTTNNDYDFEYVPERWPEINNSAGKPWYRRGIEFDFAAFLAIVPLVYAANPVFLNFAQIGTSNLTPQTIACDFYNTILQFTPAYYGQALEDGFNVTTWIIAKLDPVFSQTIFGCPASSFSNNGGSCPSNQNTNKTNNSTCFAKTNQYYKVYFPTASK